MKFALVHLSGQKRGELGPKGPKLRFRIRPQEYAACKLAREILDDARAVAAFEKVGRELGVIK